MDTAHQEKFSRMTQAPVNKLVLSLAVPTVISMLVTSFYNMADTFFVSKINTSATGAVGIVFSLMAVLQAVGFFFGQGSGNYISRMLGMQNEKEAEKMAAAGFFSSFFFGILIMILGLVFIEPLAYLLGSTKTILPYAMDYMRVILIGAPFMTSSFTLNNQLRFQGNAFYSMIGIVAGAFLNIALDPLFIFVFQMGTAGAALATVISQIVSFLLLLLGTTKGGSMHIRVKNFPFEKRYYLEICRCGTPSLLRQGIASFASISMNLAAGAYGDSAIAAMSVVMRVMLFLNSAVIGFGQGFQPVCGFNYGAGLYHRVKKAFWFCVKFATVFLIAAALAGIFLAPRIISLFTKDDMQVMEIGTCALRFQLAGFILFGWIIMSNMMMQNMGKVFRASFLALARQGIFFIPFVLILPRFFGLWGIILAQPLSDFLSFIISVPMEISVLRELNTQK